MSLYEISVRQYGGTYIATSTGLRASCTSSHLAAAQAVALKILHRDGGRAVSMNESVARGYGRNTYELVTEVPEDGRVS